MLICSVVGARPNFMKMAPVVQEIRKRGMEHYLVHTGQHYDENMSRVFFDELEIPRPDVDLNIGSDTHGRQTARIMMAFEDVCRARRPDLILVGGDVNSTAAVALVSAKEGIPLGHVEAGLRSFDRSMPEEINRVVTDHLSAYLFTTEESANENLAREGIPHERVHFVGNCMVDTLKKHVSMAVERTPWTGFGLEEGTYAVLTLHRPSNVDSTDALAGIMGAVERISTRMPILFPVHPRTRRKLDEADLASTSHVKFCEPLPYLTFLGLMARARFVLTDSGGIQEETTVLGIPCLTLRVNTERPVTLTYGTNRLVGTSVKSIETSVDEILGDRWKTAQEVPLWDGRASVRIVDILAASGRF